MSAIFKEHILPQLNTESLEASEVKAILQVLEVLDTTDHDTYKTLTNSSNIKSVNTKFTKNVAQHIYFYPKLYANEKQGLEFVASWAPLLEQGFYPDEKSIHKLVEFLQFSLGFIHSEHLAESLISQFFQVLKKLVQSESEASLPITRFLVNTIFDIRDVLSSDFLIQQCLKHNILVGNYSVAHSDQTYSTHPFKINTDFIQHFFAGDWFKFTAKLHKALPVGRVYVTSAYDIVKPWLSEELASFYKDYSNVAIMANHAIKERLIFGEVKSLELLNIKTTENIYPLIAGLGAKVWDAGEVLLFNNRDKNIPQKQLDICYLRFINWLTADGRSNFYTEAFKEYGIHILSDSTAEALPLQCIPFWFDTCHPRVGIANQTETYNTVFSKVLIKDCKGTLPLMRYQNQDFQVTGTFLIQNVFQTQNNFKAWLHNFTKAGLKNPLNQFLVRMFYDAREVLAELYNAEQQDILQVYLLALAYSARDTNDVIRTQHLPFIVKTLTALCTEPGNFTRVNEISALKNIDTCVEDLCSDFARGHYINENRSLDLNIIQAWFNYLGDFYYSYRQEAVWVSDMLTTQGVRTATYFNAIEEDVSYFLDRAINRIISFHRKCKIKSSENIAFEKISAEMEVYLTDFLGELKKDKLNANTTKYLYDYSLSTIADFSNKTELTTAIEVFFQNLFNEETTTKTATTVNNPLSITLEMEVTEINQKYVDAVLHNLENYSKNQNSNVQLLQPLDEKIEEFKVWLLDDETGIEARFNQALYMALLDTNLAPGTAQETYGNICRSLFVHLVKGTKMALSYGMGLQAMAKSGAYSEELTTALLQVVDQLNA
ncbi:hypothetical protein [uncultured Formosa sp.]|uniref:hypothetical protein n=1 Tax=uncultured Formosa sp. TaxID=255435 RepID=UPI002630DF5F|nr:hypothetical protein [uncultured Formosa sp.]